MSGDGRLVLLTPGTSYYNLQLIDEMPAGGNTTYTDNNAPWGTVYYQIVVLLTSQGTKNGNDGTIRPNVATNDNTGITDEIDNGTAIIVDGRTITVESVVGSQVRLFDAVGRELFRTISTGQNAIETPSSGIYFVKIDSYPAHRVVVVK